MLVDASDMAHSSACSDSSNPSFNLPSQADGQQACDRVHISTPSNADEEVDTKAAAAGVVYIVHPSGLQQQAVQDRPATDQPYSAVLPAAVSSDVRSDSDRKQSCGSSNSSSAATNKQKASKSSCKAAIGAQGSSSKPGKHCSGSTGSISAATAASTALAAAKLGLNDQLAAALTVTPAAAAMRDVDGRCCLHYAAAFGHEECVETLLAKGGADAVRVRDISGELPLHLAAQKGQPMCAYNIAKACPASCLVKNKRGQTPIDLAAAAARGEVLNALLLACAGDGKSAVAVAAMRALLAAGAVPDTWAPNGSSALMLAAAADGVVAVEVLLENGASIELQDALGRSALMFAAGNNAAAACKVLLDHNASLSARDRRGRAAVGYAPLGSEAAKLLQQRLEELESVANQLQQQLLQEQGLAGDKGSSSSGGAAACDASESSAGGTTSSSKGSSSSKKKKKKKVGGKAAAVSSRTGVEPPSAEMRSAETTAVEQLATDEAHEDIDDVNVIEESSHLNTAATPTASQDCNAEQQQEQPPTAADKSKQRIAVSEVLDDFEQCTNLDMLLDGSESDWQVVLPKGKQRGAAAAAGHNALPSNNNSSSAAAVRGAAVDTVHSGTAARLVITHDKHQRLPAATATGTGSVQQQQHGAHPRGSCCNTGSHRLDVVSLSSSSSCRGNAGHRRHGSAHSLCSTVSVASYESYCSSNGPGSSATTAGTPPGSCSSHFSCSTQHPRQQQQHSQKPAAVVGANTAETGAEGHATAADTNNIDSSQAAVAAHNSKAAASKPSAATEAAAGLQHTAGFKAALLGAAGAVDGLNPTGSAAVPNAVSSTGPLSRSAPPPPPLHTAADSASVPQLAVERPREQAAGPSIQSQVQGGSTLGRADDSANCTTPEVVQQQQQQLLQQQQMMRNACEGQQQQLQLAHAEITSLKQLLKQQAITHQQQLAAVLEDAATHEAAAVAAAARAAAAETLQSPLVRQLLAAAAQQAVATERTRMQLHLQQLGVPPAAQLQLLMGPVPGMEAAAHPVAAAALLAATAAASSDTAAAAAAHKAVHPTVAASSQQQQAKAAGHPNQNTAVAGGLQQARQQQQQEDELSRALRQLQLDLRSEYYGGSSSFVAPAKPPPCVEAIGGCDEMVLSSSSSNHRPTSCGQTAPLAAHQRLLNRYDSRRNSSSNCGTRADSIFSAAATRSSSSSSLAISVTDDAEIDDAHMGGFGAIGGPPGSQRSCSTPRSRALSCSPATAAAAAAADLSGHPCSPAFSTAAAAAACGLGVGASPWCAQHRHEATMKFTSGLVGTSLRENINNHISPVGASYSQPVVLSTTNLHQRECRDDTAQRDNEPLEHQLVGGLLMDEDCAGVDNPGSCGRTGTGRHRSVVDMLPDQL